MLHWSLKDAAISDMDWIGLYQLGKYIIVFILKS
jgi:hypothetical protein